MMLLPTMYVKHTKLYVSFPVQINISKSVHFKIAYISTTSNTFQIQDIVGNLEIVKIRLSGKLVF